MLLVPTQLARTRANTHTPNLCVESGDGDWTSVEIELSRKRNTDLFKVLRSYAETIRNENHPITSAVYFCGRNGIETAVTAQLRELVRHRGTGYDLITSGTMQALPYDPDEWGSVRVSIQ